MEFTPLGDCGVMISFGHNMNPYTHQKILSFIRILDNQTLPGMIEFVPGITSVAVYFDPNQLFNPQNPALLPFEIMVNSLKEISAKVLDNDQQKPRVVDIPVCYGGDFGPDLEYVSSYHNLTPQEIIDIHSQGSYQVYMIGFAPGFPYLGGMDERLATPRRNSPRLSIPMGSVGIGGNQTGIYPIESPGGWHLIGRTPLELFILQYNPPCLIETGDIIRFRPITSAEYDRMKENK